MEGRESGLAAPITMAPANLHILAQKTLTFSGFYEF
jgi:hypothetical protein